MDAATQVSSLHGVSMLDAAQSPVEANFCLALLRERGSDNDQKLINVAVAALAGLHGSPALMAAQAAREAGNSPNVVLSAALAAIGPRAAEKSRALVRRFIQALAGAGLKDAADPEFDLSSIDRDGSIARECLAPAPDSLAQLMLAGLAARAAQSVFLRFLQGLDGRPSADAVLAAIAATVAWGRLMRKRVSRLSVENLPWWLRMFGTAIGASVDAGQHEPGRFCGHALEELVGRHDLADLAHLALLGTLPGESGRFALQTLLGMLLTNGPGTISAQGAKGAVSADGPETPERVQLNKALVGFLTHTGYAHGGNGFEGVAFLMDRFRESALTDPTERKHGLDLEAMAHDYAIEYAEYKARRKSQGSADIHKIPGANHPVFKDKPVNYDPRERFIHRLLAERGEYNVFHDYYLALMRALHEAGISRTVYCVNIDAVIAALLLGMTWQAWKSGEMPAAAVESAAFTVFLYARLLGCAAEIEDHLNRGRNMDTRTPASHCRHVA